MSGPGGGVTEDDQLRALLVAYGETEDTALLTTIIDRVESAVVEQRARVTTLLLGAAAATQRARTEDALPVDLDHAVLWGEAAVGALPADDGNAALSRSNIAVALADRFQRDGDPDDLDAALRHLEVAVPGLRAQGRRVDVALHAMGLVLHERAAFRREPAGPDLARAVALFGEALACPEPSRDQRAGYLNSLGLSLRVQAAAIEDLSVLRRARAVLEEARTTARDGSRAHAASGRNLAALLHTLSDVENDPDLLRRAIALYEEDTPGLDPESRRRAEVNGAVALVDLYRYTRDRRHLDRAIVTMRAAAETSVAVEHGIVLAGLGGALHEMYENTGRLADLDAAVETLTHALAEAEPRLPERVLNLGVVRLARYRRRDDAADLDAAVSLCEEAMEASERPIERASAANTAANALSLRHDAASGEEDDLERALALRRRAIATAVPGSLDAALYRGNLGVDLLKRFDARGDPDDLRTAIREQQRAVASAAHLSSEQPRLRAALAESLERRADAHGSRVDVTLVRRTFSEAVTLGIVSMPEQALGAAWQWGRWEARRRSWDEAAGAFDLGREAMTILLGRQDARADKQAWLAAARELPVATALAQAHRERFDDAVVALEHGRALLLVEAMRRGPRVRAAS